MMFHWTFFFTITMFDCMNESLNPLWDKNSIRFIGAGCVRVVKDAIVVLVFLEVLMIVRSSRFDDVVCNNDSALLNYSLLLEPLQIWKVKIFPVINEYHVKRSMFLDKGLLSLDSSNVASNQILQSSVLMNFLSNCSCLFVWIKSVNFGFWQKSEEKRWVAIIGA